MSRELWDKLGLSRARLDALRYDCEPQLELRIEAHALKDPRFWRAYGNLLQPEFFRTAEASMLMHLAHGYAAQHHTPPEHTVARDLALRTPAVKAEDRQALLAHVDSVYRQPLLSGLYVRQVVTEMARKRAVRAAVVRVAELNERVGVDSTEDIYEVMSSVLSLSRTEEHPVFSLKEHMPELTAHLQSYTSLAVPTGIPGLDKAMLGGVLPGELGVILAPPHRGKSLTLVNLAIGALSSGVDSLFVTMEDGVRGIGPRLCARLSGMRTADYLKDPAAAQRSLAGLLKLFHSDLRLVYRRPRQTGIAEIRALLDAQASETGFRPRVLFLDYADRMRPPQKRSERWDELIDLYMELRALADEYGLAIWTASQTGRGGFAKDIVDMDDFAGAFGKAAEADIVVAYSQTREEKEAGEARLHLAKMRNRGSGQIIHIYTSPETSTIREVPAAERDQLVFYRKKKRRQGGGNGGTTPAPGATGLFPGAAPVPGGGAK